MAALLPRLPRSPLLVHFLSKARTRALAALPPTLQAPPNLPAQLPSPNPFIPTFNAATRCWAPPAYSKRRQKELLKAAEREGLAGWMPRAEGERVGGGRLRKRKGKRRMREWQAVIAEATAAEAGAAGAGAAGAVEVEVSGDAAVVELTGPLANELAHATAVLSSSAPTAPHPSTAPDTPADPTAPFVWLGQPAPIRSHPTVYGIRPREKWFKGHRWERERVEQRKEIRRRVETMDDRIKDWREAAIVEQKAKKNKSGLPF